MLGPYASTTVSDTLLHDLTNQIMTLNGTHPPDDLSSSSLLDLTDKDYSSTLPKTHKFLCETLLTEGEAGSRLGEMIPRELREYFLEWNLGDVRVEDIGRSRSVDVALIARSFCQLLQIPTDLLSPQVLFTPLCPGPLLISPQALEFIPETLQWDAERMSSLRSQIDALAVISTLLLTIKQFLFVRKCPLSNDDEQRFHTRSVCLSLYLSHLSSSGRQVA
jgi:hypothetical protein